MDISGLEELGDLVGVDPDAELLASKPCMCQDPRDQGMIHRTDGPCYTRPAESARDRLNRIETAATDLRPANLEDTNYLLSVIRRLGDQRVIGLREAAGLIRAAKQREVTTRFLVGKKEQEARGTNSKLMDTVAKLIDHYATDVEAGKL